VLLVEEVGAEPAGGVDDWGCAGEAEQHVVAGLSPDGGELGFAIEQQLGVIGLGAETPAIGEPRPSF
jgi:hypothetical protein